MMSENPYRLGIDEIRKFLPHRAPFLLVDRILEIHPAGSVEDLSPEGKVGSRCVGIKAVSYNEPFFQGHFPQFSIMPGVLIIEAMAQVSSMVVYPYFAKNLDRAADFSCVLVGVDGARFRRPVVPGDILRIESTVTKCRGKLWGFQCRVTVDGQPAAEAEILANLIAGGASA